jgi:hypothetical protein
MKQKLLNLTIISCFGMFPGCGKDSTGGKSQVDQSIVVGSWVSDCQLYTLGTQTTPIYSLSTWKFESNGSVSEVGAVYRDSGCTDKQIDINDQFKYQIVSADNLDLIPINYTASVLGNEVTIYDVVRIRNGVFFRGINERPVDSSADGSTSEKRIKSIETRMSWKKK